MQGDFLYIVIFETDDLDQSGPIVTPPMTEKQIFGTTRPHGLDRDIIPAMRGLWYCLHLPRNHFDTLDLHASLLSDFYSAELPHRIFLMPSKFIDKFPSWLNLPIPGVIPTLVLAPPGALDIAERVRLAYGIQLPVASIAEISPSTLPGHWQAIGKLFDMDELPRQLAPPPFVEKLPLSGLLLPGLWLARQTGIDTLFQGESEIEEIIYDTLRLHTHILTVAKLQGLEKENRTLVDADQLYKDFYSNIARTVKVPLAVAAPGVQRAYKRDAYSESQRESNERDLKPVPSLTWNELDTLKDDRSIEEAAFSITLMHRALARQGVSLRTEDIPQSLFQQLADLERYCAENLEEPDPKRVWRMLRRIGRDAAGVFGQAGRLAVQRASDLTIFSNFPLGLAVFEGHSAPIACSIPVTYRATLPLTRTLQFELHSSGTFYWGNGLRILIAECLSDSDPVKALSAVGWDTIRLGFADMKSVLVEITDIHDMDDLGAALERLKPDILILSAHGFYDKDRNVAGVCIGSDRIVDLPAKSVPPVVLLSSCHVSPRGLGAITIVDLLLRSGAVAVLGTLVPISAHRNALLMTRLFANIRETLDGKMPFRTLTEVWQFVMATNAIVEILHASSAFEAWSRGDIGGRRVLVEFMMHRSRGRLRKSHIYEDTESVLEEMAKETGFHETFRSTLRSQSYLPESLLYTLHGWPERIILRDENIRRHIANSSDNTPTS